MSTFPLAAFPSPPPIRNIKRRRTNRRFLSFCSDGSPRTFGEPMANRRTNDHAWRSESKTTMANSAIPSHCGCVS